MQVESICSKMCAKGYALSGSNIIASGSTQKNRIAINSKHALSRLTLDEEKTYRL